MTTSKMSKTVRLQEFGKEENALIPTGQKSSASKDPFRALWKRHVAGLE